MSLEVAPNLDAEYILLCPLSSHTARFSARFV